jgi:Abortive infection C-terminus
MAARVDLAYLSRQVTRMQEAVQPDPELAIGTAKELIETVCKTILDGLGVGFAKNDDVPALIKSAMKALGIGRDDIDPAARAADTIKRVLSNLGQIAQGTAELRNAYGTGHGRSGSTVSGLHPRHARLAVGASATLASFLYETYEEIAPPP